jgi:sulfoxide reductase catalytic subunit YedY
LERNSQKESRSPGGRVAQQLEFDASSKVNVSTSATSQASETSIGLSGRRPTPLFNGYAEFVAGMYKRLESERLWA